LCIYIETTKEMFDGFEQVAECVIAVYDAFGRLIYLDVRRIPTSVLDKVTYGK
jgi:hypothetical protein